MLQVGAFVALFGFLTLSTADCKSAAGPTSLSTSHLNKWSLAFSTVLQR